MLWLTLCLFINIIIPTAECACENCVDEDCSSKDSCNTGCVSGNYGGKCNSKCPTQCVSCGRFYGRQSHSSYNKCYECSEGYYNGSSTNCLCPLNCQQCTSTTACTVCNTGWHGSTCASQCSPSCRDNVCSLADGSCTQGCKIGTHGTHCQYKCPATCKYVDCDPSDGTCTHGCFDNFALGADGKCSVFIPGQYGTECQYQCSSNCSDNICGKSDGSCTRGCKNGTHGTHCQYQCPATCKDNICDQSTGRCSSGCTDNFAVGEDGKSLRAVDECGNNIIGPVAGGVSAALVVVVIAVVGLIGFRRWKRHGDQPQDGLNSHINNSYATLTLGKVIDQAKYEDVGDVDPEYINIMESKTDIDVSDLCTFVSKTDGEFFKKQFQQIPRASSHPYTESRKSENIHLNRFKGIFPYDHSRVKLAVDPDFYINACYIDGYKTDKFYIASVGPTAAITNKYASFWKMVWYEKSDIIVMLKILSEPWRMRCNQYWPPGVGRSRTYGDITVTNQGIRVYAEYNLTQLTVAKGKHQRSLTHANYTAWSDKKRVPDSVVSLVEFQQRVKAITTVTGGPIIVHCSAGVGNTGTYIALDVLTEQGKAEKTVNVFDCVMKLREQRVNMVQIYEQYEYLHRCIVYTLAFGSDRVTVHNIQSNGYNVNDKSYARQFQVLEQNIEKEPSDETEARDINKRHSTKNRQGSDIPGNRDCPGLFLNWALNSEPDYINAIYIDSYKKMDRYIAAQTPLPATLSDFLCLIYQHQCSCIVDMNDTASYEQHKVGTYLPAVGQTIEVDSYTVRCSSREVNSTYTTSILTVNHSSKQRPGVVCVEHYQYTGWHHDGEVPDNVGQFVQFVNAVQIAADNQTDDASPMLVHCLNAFERTGLFCTVAVVLEKLEDEQQVSISNTIRQIRLRRKKAIPNKAQFKFCHECAVAYTDMNFAM